MTTLDIEDDFFGRPLTDEENDEFVRLFDLKMQEAHQCAIDHGWWEDGYEDRNKAEMICLMHSELSEALEALRKDAMDDKLTQYKGDGVELGDTNIRIFDYCAAFDIPLGRIIVEKMSFNDKRPHKHGGKKF